MQYPRTAKTETGKALEDTISQLIFKEGGGLQPWAFRMLSSRAKHIFGVMPPQSIDANFITSELFVKAKPTVRAILEGLCYQHEFEKALYDNSYSRLKASNLTWEQMLASEITSDEDFKNEIFVRLVEEKHGVEVTSWKQLQELTGLEEFYLSHDEETGDFTKQKITKKEAQDLAKRELQDTFLKAMQYRYRRLLESILVSGGKYKDLLEPSPTEFYLPEESKTQTIAWTIGLYFGMGDPEYSELSVRSVADQIDAPYGVVLSAMRRINS